MHKVAPNCDYIVSGFYLFIYFFVVLCLVCFCFVNTDVDVLFHSLFHSFIHSIVRFISFQPFSFKHISNKQKKNIVLG